MTTYADPTRCPDCRAMLGRDPQTCRTCSLPLTGETVVSLFTTLQEADRLLGVLRTQKVPVPAAVGVPTTSAHNGSLLDGAERYPAPTPARPDEIAVPRLSGSSVPKILLSLGALCLLVAAVIFLAVAWTWLGVGGRTAVLVALTATALGSSVALHRRDLRTAAEALCVIGLGLLAVDVWGVERAGWLGNVGDGHLEFLPGAVVGTGALLMLVATARRPLVAPALVAPFAVLVAGMGAEVDATTLVPIAVTVALLLGLGRVGTVLPSPTLQISSLVAATLGWVGLVVGALSELEGPPVTFDHYVRDLAGWPFLAATVLAAVVGPVTGMRRVSVPGYALAALTATWTVLLPVLDNAPTAMVSAVLGAAVLWVVVLVVAPRPLRPVALVPLGGSLVVPTVAAVLLLDDAVEAVTSVGAPFTASYDVHVVAGTTWVSPLLLVPALVTFAAAVCAAVRLMQPTTREAWAVTLGSALFLGAVGTLALYDVPLVLVVGLLVWLAATGLVVAERLSGNAAVVVHLAVLVLMSAAALAALPSDVATTAVLAVACLMAGVLMHRTDSTGVTAGCCFPIAFTGLVWAGANVAGIDPQLRALPVLVVLGALCIWRPQPELEVFSALCAVAASAAAISAAPDVAGSLAVHLTIGGALVTATSIVHPERRALAWVGGLILAVDTWVRLYDLGVHVPEAYTLPSALALVAVGAWRLHRDDRSATLRFLAPGLTLATVPSLVATLDDPASLRALLLGAACLGLVLGGVAFRLSAPLIVGAVVGALLVLLELAPYAGYVPTWLTIGVSGAVLLGVGITWESRMRDVHRATEYVAALR